jgi:TRAP-type uncharacterized transport system substrate-binding protein
MSKAAGTSRTTGTGRTIGAALPRALAIVAIAATALIQPRTAAAQDQAPRRLPTYEMQQERINAWTVGLAAGLLEGAPLRLASEIARVVDDGANLHVLPVVTRGPTENVNSLLYLRGIDLAIINADVLDEYRIQLPDIRKHVTYLLTLFPSEMHVFVRPEITSLQDLAGKKVNFNTLGTTAAYSGPLIFSRLGIDVQKTFIPHQLALQQMRSGTDMAAVVFVTSKPVDAFQRIQWEGGFRFLPIPYEARFEDFYLPAALDNSDYPALVKQGERIPTVAVPTVLVAYNWPLGGNRYQRVARFTEQLFSRIDRLQVAGFDAKWKTVNLRASMPGLTRFPAAQEWLDRQERKSARRQ